MMKIYRIENTKHHGMWYNNQAKPTPSIKKSQEYPMEYSERFRKDGKVWLSTHK